MKKKRTVISSCYFSIFEYFIVLKMVLKTGMWLHKI